MAKTIHFSPKYLSINRCPCGAGKSFAECCEPYLLGAAHAPDARMLMRSRYTAYTLLDEAYLQRTWHASTVPVQILKNEESIKWLGLTVIDHQELLPFATVEFIAKYKISGRAGKLHEKSRFVFEDGQWFYIDGVFLN